MKIRVLPFIVPVILGMLAGLGDQLAEGGGVLDLTALGVWARALVYVGLCSLGYMTVYMAMGWRLGIRHGKRRLPPPLGMSAWRILVVFTTSSAWIRGTPFE